MQKIIMILFLIFCVFPSHSTLYAQMKEQLNTKSFQEALQSSARQQAIPYAETRQKNFWLAATELIALQLLPNYFNRHVSDDTTAVLSWDSWDRNVREGFEWDPNSLTTNMFSHPYHGAMFFNAGRANGYNFWESIPWAFAGSFIWEFFGENNRAAVNDWAMTSFGGITIGEGLHRASCLLLDNQAKGAERAFRELGAFFINPVGGFNRAVKGEMTKIGPNPLEKYPKSLHTLAHFGSRTVWERFGDGQTGDYVREEAGTFLYFDIDMNYGDPMRDYDQPFDAFRLTLQLNGKNRRAANDSLASMKTGIGMLQVHGTVYGMELKQTEKVRHTFTMDLLFDYANNQSYEFGGQAFGFGLRSSWKLSHERTINTIVQPSLIILAAVDNPLLGRYEIFEDRRYDFGSGLGLRLLGQYTKSGYNYITLGYRGFYHHTANGARGSQVVQFAFIGLNYPIWQNIGIGVQYLIYRRDSWYKRIPETILQPRDTHIMNPELRISASFFW